MAFMNCTPHDIKVVGTDGVKIFPKSGTVIRISSRRHLVGNVNGVDLYSNVFGKPETVVDGVATPGLPPPQEGVLVIVSGIVRDKCPDRFDFISPGDQVRDENGVVIGCRGFDIK